MRIIKAFDSLIGRFFYLETLGFQEVKDFKSISNHNMVKDEWMSYRSLEQTSDNVLTNWLDLLAGKERRKFFIFDFLSTRISKNSKLLDIGCGQAHISVMLYHFGIDVDFSEYDDSVIPNKLKPYSDKFHNYDFENISVNELSKYDDILMVQVDYIFSTNTLIKFFKKCKLANVRVHIVNTQIFGPARYFKFKSIESKRKNDRSIKQHGFMRTIGSYKKIAALSNYKGIKSKKISGYNDEISSYYYFNFF